MKCEGVRFLQQQAQAQRRRQRKHFLARLLLWFGLTVGVWAGLTYGWVRYGQWLESRDEWNRQLGHVAGWDDASKFFQIQVAGSFKYRDFQPTTATPGSYLDAAGDTANPFSDLRKSR